MRFNMRFRPSVGGRLWKYGVRFRFDLQVDKRYSYIQIDRCGKQVFGHTWRHVLGEDDILPEWHETSLLRRLVRTALGESFNDTSTKLEYIE